MAAIAVETKGIPPPQPLPATGETTTNKSQTSQPAKDDGKKKVRKVRRSTKSAQEAKKDERNALRGPEREKELTAEFTPLLSEFSRQRLRMLLMSLRRSGNVEARINVKDLLTVFQEHNLKIPSHILQIAVEIFEDSAGIDYERLWRCMASAQANSGRDSALAMRKRNDLESTQRFLSENERDSELIRRITEQMATSKDDLQALKKSFQIKDRNKTGKLTMEEVLQITNEKNISVYGAVLKALIKRCETGNAGQISWPELLSFLEKGHPSASNASKEKAKPGAENTTAPVALNPFTGRPLDRAQSAAPTLKRSIRPQLSRELSVKNAKMALRANDRPSTATNRPLTANRVISASQISLQQVTSATSTKGSSNENQLSKDSTGSANGTPKSSMNISIDNLKPTAPGSQKPKAKFSIGKNRPQSAAVGNSARSQQRGSSARRVHSARPRAYINTNGSVVGRRRVSSSASRISLRSNADDNSMDKTNTNNNTNGTSAAGQSGTTSGQSLNGAKTNQNSQQNNQPGAAAKKGKNGSPRSPNAENNGPNNIATGTVNISTEKNEDLENSAKGKQAKHVTLIDEPTDPSEITPRDRKSSVSKMKETTEAAGLFSSMKSFFSGKKKGNVPEKQAIDATKETTPSTGILKNSSMSSRYKTSNFQTKTVDVREPNGKTSDKSPINTDKSVENNKTASSNEQGKKTEVVIKGKVHLFNSFPGSNSDLPSERPTLQWIYGYQGNDGRKNIHVLASEEIVYFISSYVILYDKTNHVQRHYKEHTGDIKCMTVHQNGVTVASGQGDETSDATIQAHIRIWRADTLQTLHIVGQGLLKKSVGCVTFSCIQIDPTAGRQTSVFNDQDRLLATDEAAENVNMFIWEVANGKIIASVTLPTSLICDATFCPRDSNIIAIAGKEYLSWWQINIEKGTLELIITPDYQDYLRAMYVHCLYYTRNGELITGDSNGTVYVWPFEGNKICNIIKHAHEEPVFSMLLHRGHLITAGRDGAIRGWLWGKNMDKSGDIKIPYAEGGVRAIQVYRDQLIIGTTTNSILTATLSGPALRNPLAGITLNPYALTEGHYGTVTALCRPPDPEYHHLVMSLGKDGVACLFDTQRRVPMWKHRLKKTKVLCADLVKDNILVVGTKDGVSMLDMIVNDDGGMEIDVIFTIQLQSPSGSVTAIKATPDCETIAAGDAQGIIHVLGIVELDTGEQQWDVVGRLEGHSGMVTSLDWSSELRDDSLVLRSSSNVPEIMYWNNSTLTRITDDDMVSHMQWQTNTCWLSGEIAGIWLSNRAKEADITSVNVNSSNSLIAVGDSQGQVSIYRYPCTTSLAFSHQFKAHSNINQVYFTGGGQNLLTVGGADQAVLQWLLQ